MDFTQFAWRDGVLIIAVAIGVYVAVMLLRLLQVGKKKHDGIDLASDASNGLDPADAAPPPMAEPELTTAEYELPFSFPPPAAARFAAQPSPPPAAAVPLPPTFSETLGSNLLEQELRRLRAEVAALRDELQDLKAAQRVSPQYGDAMALAQRGYDARGIAEHCGIAQGEAELVMALARGADGLREDDGYEAARAEWGRRPA